MRLVDRDIEKLIGQRLKKARLEAGLTQAALAEKTGIKFQQLQKYESGKNRISSFKLLQSAIILDQPVSYFLCDARAVLTGRQLLSEPRSLDDVETIFGYGLIVHEIRDPAFRRSIINLIRRHNKIAEIT
ncbi:helix-turn-helix domain-containing protein [Pararhizobium sp. IMCC21322]|uniref:helix-turn-helix domain-containing protein n=1 Tax=Pararhizobium sp. IMCC21322 TaxID=3067903 RepID=UPI0027420643|nr:helix-turn-helix transcriptional regulator [Pararhizobium sp. IMCC21322]